MGSTASTPTRQTYHRSLKVIRIRLELLQRLRLIDGTLHNRRNPLVADIAQNRLQLVARRRLLCDIELELLAACWARLCGVIAGLVLGCGRAGVG